MGEPHKNSIGEGLAWAPAIQHPLDAIYLNLIQKIPLLPKIMGWVVDQQRAETETILSGDGCLVTEKSCPSSHSVFAAACSALDLDASRFRFFCVADPKLNAFTTGSEIPTICATSGLINTCSEEELAFVIGHELGHYICGHVRCHSLARYLSDALVFTPVWLAVPAIRPVIMSWARYSELSADRAGLLACKDFDAASRVYLKLAGFPAQKADLANPQRILAEQSIQYAEQLGKRSLWARLSHQAKHGFSASHPRAVERFAALDEWRGLGCYDDLADATPAERIRVAQSVGTDYLKNALDMAVVEAAADYAEQELGKPRKESLRLLRKAFLHGGSLQGTSLDEIVYAELAVEERKDGDCEYTLALFLLRGRDNPVKVTLPVDYTADRDFAPDEIRGQFIKTRRKQLKVLVYKPQN
jgi:hypothetical protein